MLINLRGRGIPSVDLEGSVEVIPVIEAGPAEVLDEVWSLSRRLQVILAAPGMLCLLDCLAVDLVHHLWIYKAICNFN